MIILASDHAGFELKKILHEYLKGQGLEVQDIGPGTYDETDDYPDTIFPAAEKVAEKPDEHLGIILGGSGQGEAIVANKVPGIRAVVYYGGNTEILKLSKEHNNANILALGARFLSEEETTEAVSLWLETKFSQEDRHKRRIEKISQYEKRKK